MAGNAELVTALIIDRPTCIRCIAVKSGLTPRSLDRVIGAVAAVLVLRRVTDRCRACGTTDIVLFVDRPQ